MKLLISQLIRRRHAIEIIYFHRSRHRSRWINTYHLNGTERLACTMTCLCARRIDVQRVASYARGRAELARKTLVVDVASRRRTHIVHGESHVRWLTAPVVFKKTFFKRALFFETCHSHVFNKKHCKNLLRVPAFFLALFSFISHTERIVSLKYR